MQHKDNHIRKELELESFLQKLDMQKGREVDSERLRSHVRRELLTKSPREIRDLFPDLWEEYKLHSRNVEATRKKVLEVITRDDFDIVALEQSIAESIETSEGKDFAFRAHQADGLEKIGEFFRKPGRRSGYIKLPTGMGKTILFSALIRVFCENNPDTRVLILSPRSIVNEQNLQAINRLQTPETVVGITEGGKKIVDAQGEIINENPNALVSTYQLLANSPVDKQKFGKRDVIILDELHRSFGLRTVETLKSSYPNAIFLGLSATPYLGDPTAKNPKRAEDYIGECIMSISLPEAIESGALVPVRGFLVHTKGEEIDKLIQAGEDLSDAEYEEKIDGKQRSEIALKILGEYMEKGTKKLTRRAIIYCAGIEHTEETAKMLTDAGLSAAYVHSKMAKNEIKQIIADYKNGKYDVICNSDMLIEGFDDEGISLLINLRPTRSLTVFEQMIGRALRLDANNPGKIAHVYNVTGRFSEEYTIYGLAKYYKKLEKLTKNGSLVFPTKLSDIERKIQKYEVDGVIPDWTEEEKALMKQYLPEWYKYFIQKIDSFGKGSRPRDNSAAILDFPDIIETDNIEIFNFPMDFEYFQNIENLRVDLNARNRLSDDAMRFMCANGRDLTVSNYLTAIKNNVPGMELTSVSERRKWWEKRVRLSNMNIDEEYFQNAKFLSTDYEKMKELLTKHGRRIMDAPYLSKSASFYREDHNWFLNIANGDFIPFVDYLYYIENFVPEMKGKNEKECFDWLRQKIGIIILNESYFQKGEYLASDYKSAQSMNDFIEKGNPGMFLCSNGEYIGMNSYLRLIETNVPKMKGKTNMECMDWWIEAAGTTKFTTEYFKNFSNLMEDYKNASDQCKGPMHNNLDTCFLLSDGRILSVRLYLEFMRSSFNELNGMNSTECSIWWKGRVGKKEQPYSAVYFQNLEIIKYDYENAKISYGYAGVDWITGENIGKTFLSSTGEEISLKKYFWHLRKNVPSLTNADHKECLDWWQFRCETTSLNVSYFEDILNLKVDYRALKKASNKTSPGMESLSVSFSPMSGDDISLSEYLNAIRIYVPSMKDKDNGECLNWWKKQVGG